MGDTKKRGLLKGVTYKILSTIVTILVIYVVTQKLDVSFFWGVVCGAVNLGVFYLNERSWGKVAWGKEASKKKEVISHGRLRR